MNLYLRIALPLMLGSILLAACKPDPCEALTCENGGVCNGGECDCPEGFTGPACNISLDPCANKGCDSLRTQSCISSGAEALCICRDGFEGTLCQSEWADKYAGTYICQESCNGTGISFNVTVTKGPEFKRITIGNFSNRQTATQSARVVARLNDPEVLEIYEQFMPFGKVQGIGSRDGSGNLSLVYTIISGKDTLSCSALLVRQ